MPELDPLRAAREAARREAKEAARPQIIAEAEARANAPAPADPEPTPSPAPSSDAPPES